MYMHTLYSKRQARVVIGVSVRGDMPHPYAPRGKAAYFLGLAAYAHHGL